MFCFPDSLVPRSNDFRDFRRYYVARAIFQSLAQIRNDDGVTPMSVKRFLLDLLRYNDNCNNEVCTHA